MQNWAFELQYHCARSTLPYPTPIENQIGVTFKVGLGFSALTTLNSCKLARSTLNSSRLMETGPASAFRAGKHSSTYRWRSTEIRCCQGVSSPPKRCTLPSVAEQFLGAKLRNCETQFLGAKLREKLKRSGAMRTHTKGSEHSRSIEIFVNTIVLSNEGALSRDSPLGNQIKHRFS